MSNENTALDENAVLTRYIPLSKLVALLSGGIYCAPAHCLDDSWEGHAYFTASIASTPRREKLQCLVNKARPWVYISCWHYASAESYAMWQIYGRSDDAVAVHTTAGRLKLLARNYVDSRRRGDIAPVAVLAQVKYTPPGIVASPFGPGDRLDVCSDHGQLEDDQDKRDWVGLMGCGFGVKLDAYAYEKEVRLLVLDENAPRIMDIMTASPPAGGHGLLIPVPDFRHFLTGVTVSPKAPIWFLDVLQTVTQRFNVDEDGVPVKRSILFSGPGKMEL
jgi:hypothetical protein